MRIAAVLREVQDRGEELDAETVARAVEMGRRQWEEQQAKPSVPVEKIAPHFESIVYYVLRGPLVKIGTTVRPARRFAALMPDAILAVEPGDKRRERQRHAEFRPLRVGTSEYFQRSQELDAHIERVRAEFGAPNPSWPTTQDLGRPRPDFHPAPPPAVSADTATVREAARVLGVAANTISGWVYRQLLSPVGKNEQGRPLYLLDEMRFLAGRSKDLVAARKVSAK
ncbi:GIY-YIG nuclease family protein [Streptomyces cylindrosporus]|uniref:GIY-YIG nuclease family protein n=1 Tax=Streptomyces cylindrosporus TaxID=2927583 RepID=A0ABS9YL54_9ACTN|nr:GIY-YIG nuclease family protein [Streptomyces cylindrosporus]MCI3277634.1 GIY-YIG nuclease family protein [Streptomyces cylindrosporus]